MNDRKKPPVLISNKALLFVGLSMLGMGALVYLILRSPDQIYFTKHFGIHRELFEIQSPILKSIGYRLPAFIHVFALILITASFFNYSRRTCLVISAGWFSVDCLFELGQKYKTVALCFVPGFFDKIPYLEGTRNYFLWGTFDLLDIVAYALGAVTAFWVLTATSRHGRTSSRNVAGRDKTE